MNTKLVSCWQPMGFHSSIDLNEISADSFGEVIDKFLSGQKPDDSISMLLEHIFDLIENKLNAERWISLSNNVFLDKKAKGYWIIKNNNQDFGRYHSGFELCKVKKKINEIINDANNEWSIPDKETLLLLVRLSHASFSICNDHLYSNFNSNYLYRLDDFVQGFNCNLRFLSERDNGYALPFLQAYSVNSSARDWFIDILKHGFLFDELKNMSLYQTLYSLFLWVNKNKEYNMALLLDNDIKKELTTYYLSQKLLQEDNVRANIHPYQQKILENIELGHWSLWQNELDLVSSNINELSPSLVARNPKSCINDGAVAIDFGCVSTVVVYQKDTVHIHPLYIEQNDLINKVDTRYYENPTIIECINVESFISAYKSRENRPYTRWQDLKIAHAEQHSMQRMEFNRFHSFLDEIKQWTADRNRELKIIDGHDKIIHLSPFLDSSLNDFNPIEIYAYYLGLYINNLNTGIFMEYILSFPATFDFPVRNKILHSFEIGLKKSLPAELGKETINKLSVIKSVNEATAYGLTALKYYGFEPVDNENIFYSVFDFGGGTTDFSFGFFRTPQNEKEKRRFDYVIEHLGAGGDKFLGGDNLLKLLAFEVVKKNAKILLEKNIQFELFFERNILTDHEQLFSFSNEAKRNTKQLCIALNSFWQNPEAFCLEKNEELTIVLNDIYDFQHDAFLLTVNKKELEDILLNRIEEGIENFFFSLKLAFNKLFNTIDSIKIFLAGGSSKSKYVKELFNKYTHFYCEKIIETRLNFEVFDPLKLGKNPQGHSIDKLAVALGLMELREGGRIKIIDHDQSEQNIEFNFYLGENRKNKFHPIIDRSVALGQWIAFTDASYKKFEIYYTEHTYAKTGNMSITDTSIRKKTIELMATDEESSVYIRRISTTRIEYVIASENDIENEIYQFEIQSVELSISKLFIN